MKPLTSCAACRYWFNGPKSKDNAGECRRYAPQYSYIDRQNYKQGVWLTTYASDWCGDGEARGPAVEPEA